MKAMENPHPDDWFSVEMSCIGGQTDMKRLGKGTKNASVSIQVTESLQEAGRCFPRHEGFA